jgi:hypothetical protein
VIAPGGAWGGRRYAMAATADDDLDGLGAPNCREDLVPMEDAGAAERPYWRGPGCRRTSIAES